MSPDGAVPLPEDAARLLSALGAPPRLRAHLSLVHGVAVRLVEWTARHHPQARIDAPAVLFGAATHDIGKTLHPAELSGPGSAHEEAGYALLREHGVASGLARFCRTHGSYGAPGRTLEDLLVSLADTVWKGRRAVELEQRVVELLARASGRAGWEVFLELDDLLGDIAAGADERLAHQARHPLTGPR
ncbi:hypothetical protein HDA32_002513 [Spinactinospora alkalitolerans]|uniref:HD domain-containing protein n=1 Tax=Spinactinospora alkalitolerans TaxID=687207 RepID=A0A852TX30_9ACTN|nr:HD domain-containing protein [Spinactinospora alkalitolerans]NYE47393.1 hypothetical protein [Spinactinospora alkalitolerans]